MAYYLRRSLRFGPLRFNFSKSGIGISTGITGARVGLNSRGTYVHGGRHGLYYRKRIGSRARRGRAASAPAPQEETFARPQTNTEGMGTGLLIIALVVAALVAFGVGTETGVAYLLLVGFGVGLYVYLRQRNRRRLEAYKHAVDQALVLPDRPPAAGVLEALRLQRQALVRDQRQARKLSDLEAEAYQALLDKAIDDRKITREEYECIRAAESVFGLSEAERTAVKKEIFVDAYFAFIEDQIIAPHELRVLENFARGLGLPQEAIADEVRTVEEMLRAQRLEWPLEAVDRTALGVNILQSETAYYTAPATVLTRRKDRHAPGGYVFTPWREGVLVVTDRRFFVSGEGSTEVRFSEIADIEVDLDRRLVCITKTTSGRPVFLETAEAIYAGRIIDVANEQWKLEQG